MLFKTHRVFIFPNKSIGENTSTKTNNLKTQNERRDWKINSATHNNTGTANLEWKENKVSLASMTGRLCRTNHPTNQPNTHLWRMPEWNVGDTVMYFPIELSSNWWSCVRPRCLQWGSFAESNRLPSNQLRPWSALLIVKGKLWFHHEISGEDWPSE